MPSLTCYLPSKLKSMKNKPTTTLYGLPNKKNVPENLNSEPKKFNLLTLHSKKPPKL